MIRHYRAADRAACLAIFDASVPADFRSGERAGFEQFLDALPGPYLVIEEEGEVVACGGYAVEADGRTASLCWGMVSRRVQGRGLGRHLLDARVERALGGPGVERVRLSTSQRTRAFFEKAGFRVESVVPDGHAPGLDRVEMSRGLTTPRPP
jgi:ribosomal protein S18 acetylase RimI-like enzyme